MNRWFATAAASTAGLTSRGHRGRPRIPNQELEVRARRGNTLELWTNQGTHIATLLGKDVPLLRQTMDDALELLPMPEPVWPGAPAEQPAPAATENLNARPIRDRELIGLYRGDELLHTLSVAGCMQAALDLGYAQHNLLMPPTATSAPTGTAVPPSPAHVAGPNTPPAPQARRPSPAPRSRENHDTGNPEHCAPTGHHADSTWPAQTTATVLQLSP